MKFFQSLKNKTAILLIVFVIFALLLHLYKIELPCLNSDEAAFGYNAYSIFKTGKDEYGTFMPLRFKSFGENKLPVIEYLSAPFMVFGLNEVTTRMIIYIMGIIAPVVMYFFIKEIVKDERIALITAFLTSLSPWIQMNSRHTHEVLIAFVLITTAIIMFHKFLKKFQLKYFIIFSILNGLALFTYHVSKIYAVFFFGWLIVSLCQHSKKGVMWVGKMLIIFIIPVLLFILSEYVYPTTRISNLLFYKTSGFTASIEELRREHDIKLIHNKVSKSIIQLSNQYISYFSPEFLVVHGDSNDRFGFDGISPVSIVEYIFLLVGLYYLFKNKASGRYLLLLLLLYAPLSASISWQEYSLTRAFYMIVPILSIAAYGIYYFLNDMKQYKYIAGLSIMLAYLFFTFFTWDFYFHHYFKKPQVMESWQCGYKEVAQYIKQNYYKYDAIYLSKKAGQPYIFTLFYLQYPPEKYQKVASLSPLDEYGFGQVDHFDKFIFNFDYPGLLPNSVLIGKPEEFAGSDIDRSLLKKIQVNGEDMFYIYEPTSQNPYAYR